MKVQNIHLLFAGCILFFSCNNVDKSNSVETLKAKTEVENIELNDFRLEEDADTTIVAKQQKATGNQQQTQSPQIDWDKKIIKNANVNLEVKDYDSFNKIVREKIRQLSGYISQEEQNQSDYKIENTLVIKVPVDRFDEALSQLTAGAEKINEKRITSEDVTADYFDTRSRMEAKKQVRIRYLELLKQAKNMEEILNVQNEINSIQEEIESAAGRIQYLGHASSYSTINLNYYQVLNAAAKDDAQPSFGTKLSHAFNAGWSWVGDFVIGVISIWPLWLLVFAGVIVYKKIKPARPKQA